MKKYFLFSSLFFFITVSSAADIKKITIHPDEKILLSGNIQFIKEEDNAGNKKKHKKRITGIMLIEETPDNVWRVIEDWDAMEEYVPSLNYCKTVHVFERPDNSNPIRSSLIESQLQVLFLRVTYTMLVTFEQTNHLQYWNLVSDKDLETYAEKNIKVKKNTDSIRHISGYQYLEPFDGGSKSLFYYSPVLETYIPLPDFIERTISTKSITDFMQGVRSRVMKLYSPSGN